MLTNVSLRHRRILRCLFALFIIVISWLSLSSDPALASHPCSNSNADWSWSATLSGPDDGYYGVFGISDVINSDVMTSSSNSKISDSILAVLDNGEWISMGWTKRKLPGTSSWALYYYSNASDESSESFPQFHGAALTDENPRIKLTRYNGEWQGYIQKSSTASVQLIQTFQGTKLENATFVKQGRAVFQSSESNCNKMGSHQWYSLQKKNGYGVWSTWASSTFERGAVPNCTNTLDNPYQKSYSDASQILLKYEPADRENYGSYDCSKFLLPVSEGYKQIYSKWCWAANSQAVLKLLNDSTPIQSTMAEWLYPPPASKYQGATLDQTQAVLSNWGVTGHDESYSLSFSQIKDQTTHGHPVFASSRYWDDPDEPDWSSREDGVHDTLIRGYDDDSTDLVYFTDPADGKYHSQSYANYVKGKRWDARWHRWDFGIYGLKRK